MPTIDIHGRAAAYRPRPIHTKGKELCLDVYCAHWRSLCPAFASAASGSVAKRRFVVCASVLDFVRFSSLQAEAKAGSQLHAVLPGGLAPFCRCAVARISDVRAQPFDFGLRSRTSVMSTIVELRLSV